VKSLAASAYTSVFFLASFVPPVAVKVILDKKSATFDPERLDPDSLIKESAPLWSPGGFVRRDRQHTDEADRYSVLA
jgi:hypothetical protein